jgi:SAM-dependent methyltransferase
MKRRYQTRVFLRHRKASSYRPGWRFPLIVEHAIREWVVSPSLHVCSGQSTLGDVKLDLYERADVKAAMRYLPFRPGSFGTVIWDPPYAMHRRQTMPCLIELRRALRPGGRLIVVHYFDPSSFLQRSMRLLYKAYYDPKAMGGVRVVTVLELLPTWRLKPGRRDRLVEVTDRSDEILVSVPAAMWEPEQLQVTQPQSQRAET